jgi:putative colanic acid biosynthesis acetyltransferase WcaF
METSLNADQPTRSSVSLASFDNHGYDRGRPKLVEAAWMIVQALFVSSALPGSAHRRILLRLFGAQIGQGVVIKPRVRIKFPWRLFIGDHTWIGEGAWIDNLGDVSIGSDVCVSQESYICTGSHNWKARGFDLMVAPVEIGAGAWIAARACIAPGVKVGEGAILTIGSVAVNDLEPWFIYSGNPALKKRSREINL